MCHVILWCVCAQEEEVSKIAELFPFTGYFSTAPQPVFKGVSFAEDLDIAEVGMVLVM